MPEPFELMATPFDVYLAPAETDKPDIGEDVAASGSDWVLLGKNGAAEYDEAGITVTHQQTIEMYRGLRGTGPVKSFRTSEDLTFGFTLNDLTVESYAKVVNDALVDVSSGNSRAVALHQGPQVATFALLARSPDGPYGDGAPCQYWIPKVSQSGSPAVVHAKGKPAGLALVFTAMENLNASSDEERFGVFEAADEPLGS
jgi:hypothetical protein